MYLLTVNDKYNATHGKIEIEVEVRIQKAICSISASILTLVLPYPQQYVKPHRFVCRVTILRGIESVNL